MQVGGSQQTLPALSIVTWRLHTVGFNQLIFPNSNFLPSFSPLLHHIEGTIVKNNYLGSFSSCSSRHNYNLQMFHPGASLIVGFHLPTETSFESYQRLPKLHLEEQRPVSQHHFNDLSVLSGAVQQKLSGDA